jgi:UDP-3-O-[3-hydroxymyristoyl] N-acetylglucosamine deacetylase/3-hydroxyacyl-[acyl-carrier-protein] dehydratase
MDNQRTIKNSVEYSGIGLHTGNESTMIIKPGLPNSGVRFVRTDLNPPVEIKVDVDHVVDTIRGTTIGLGEVQVHTVEHVLAALAGLGIDNLIIELNANEPPVGDGSSVPFVEMLNRAEIVEQDAPKNYLYVEKPIWFTSPNGSQIVALPDKDFKITCTVDYHHPVLKAQYGTFTIHDGVFEHEIAPSRTFCFNHEVEMLRSQGLIRGGSLENAVVIGEDKILNEQPLRFEDEFVRHKILDLIGDLYLFGRPVKGHIVAVKSGHTTNVAMVRKLKEFAATQDPVKLIPKPSSSIKAPLDVCQIQKILPHRYPFLLVDRILKLEINKFAVGIKNVSINESFFEGHFPDHPVMPGVLIVEAMAQVAGVLLLHKEENRGKLAYLLGIDNAKFRRTVVPGDQIKFEVEVKKIKGRTGKVKGHAYVDEKVVAEAEMTFSLVPPL